MELTLYMIPRVKSTNEKYLKGKDVESVKMISF